VTIREGWSKKLDEVRWPFDPPIAGGIRKGTGEASRPDGPYEGFPYIVLANPTEGVIEDEYGNLIALIGEKCTNEVRVDVDHETPE
jgi:hypothetical protein